MTVLVRPGRLHVRVCDLPPVNFVKVLDGSDNELFSETDAIISIDTRTRYDFSASPLEADSITIRFDAINLGNLSDDIGFDNIHFGQVPGN